MTITLSPPPVRSSRDRSRDGRARFHNDSQCSTESDVRSRRELRWHVPMGEKPSALRQANDGRFYGTTSNGGTFEQGTLFRMDVTGVVTTLYSFSGTADGGEPFGLVSASNGRFYGVTQGGACELRNGI